MKLELGAQFWQSKQECSVVPKSCHRSSGKVVHIIIITGGCGHTQLPIGLLDDYANSVFLKPSPDRLPKESLLDHAFDLWQTAWVTEYFRRRFDDINRWLFSNASFKERIEYVQCSQLIFVNNKSSDNSFSLSSRQLILNTWKNNILHCRNKEILKGIRPFMHICMHKLCLSDLWSTILTKPQIRGDTVLLPYLASVFNWRQYLIMAG